ncbi:hypothetical protein [Saccharolobus shibatae]|nr:hypothetical protein [Saccharolobus shibatae]
MIRILKDLGYTVSSNLPSLPPGSMTLGSISAMRDDLQLEFNNVTGTISFFTQSLGYITLIKEEVRKLISDLRLGKIDYIEVTFEAILNGRLNLDLKILGGDVVGIEIVSDKKNVRINSYMAMADSSYLLITYKLNEINEIGNAVDDMRKTFQELENLGLR